MIAFAVYRGEVQFDQQLGSDISSGDLINRLSSRWPWMGVPRKFFNSDEITDQLSEDSGSLAYSETLYVEWLRRVLRKFMKTKAKNLLVMNSSLFLPEGFEVFTEYLTSKMQSPIDAISIWPSMPIEITIPNDDNKLYNTSELSKLCFILKRASCKKLLSRLEDSLHISFSDLVKQEKIVCRSISTTSSKRPYLWLQIAESEDRWLKNITPKESTGLLQLFEQTQSDKQVKSVTKDVKIHAFISHWYSTWDNIAKIEDASRAVNFKTDVLNTTNRGESTWINDVPISFFRQIERACRSFDSTSDYMLIITADVISDDWIDFFEYAQALLSQNSLGSFSPTLTHEYYHLGRYSTTFMNTKEPLAIVLANDLIVTYIHRASVLKLLEFFDFFNSDSETFSPKVGYGLMTTLNLIIKNQNRDNVRDRSYTLIHRPGTSYDVKEAEGEREGIYKIAEKFFSQNSLVWDRSSLKNSAS